MKVLFFVGCFLLLVQVQVFCQISIGGTPISFSIRTKSAINQKVMPWFDSQLLLHADSINESSGKLKKLHFAKTFQVEYSTSNSGQWQTLENGTKLWLISIKSEGAFSLNLIFTQFKLPVGAQLFIYNKAHTQILGAFTHANNNPEQILATAPVSGDEIIVEYSEPVNPEFNGILTIGQVAHDYRNAFNFGADLKKEGFCHIDVNCPQGTDWQNEKRSIAKIVIDGSDLCTGCLVANTGYTSTPYFFTAAHCVSDQKQASRLVFLFEYEKTSCNGGTIDASKSISGSTLKATSQLDVLDFSLLQLNSVPPAEYHPFYAGWSISKIPSASAVTIHHPDGAPKKISFEKDTLITGDFSPYYQAYTHWQVRNWEYGVTEPGSSGAPLFDKNHRLIGDLTGGDSYCGYANDDFFQKFDVCWAFFASQNQQLKAWLDPLNTGITEMNGLDPYSVITTDVQLLKIEKPNGIVCQYDVLTPEFVVKNNGNIPVTSFDIVYQIDQLNKQTFTWRGYLLGGSSVKISSNALTLDIGEHVLAAEVVLPQNQADDVPLNNNLTQNFSVYSNAMSPEIMVLTDFCVGKRKALYTSKLVGTKKWTTSWGAIIGSSTSDTVMVDWLPVGTKTVKLEITNGCGTISNTLQAIPAPNSVKLNLLTDNNASDTYWEVINSANGKSVYSGRNYSNSQLVTDNFCFQNGLCYTFTIYDKSANGICCNNGSGNYSLVNVKDETVLKNGGEFLWSESNVMCFTTSDVNRPSAEQTDYLIYPNPVQNELHVSNSEFLKYTYEIVNLWGIKLLTGSGIGNIILDINSLPEGLYFIYFQTSEKRVCRKFMKML